MLISAANAIVRKAFDLSCNAWLEIQWYLFSAVFLLCAGYTLLRNEHVRIDVIAGRFSRRTQTWIDIFGTIFFLLPMVALILYAVVALFVRTWLEQGDLRANAGGLILWPATAAGAGRLRAARAAGPLGAGQAHRVPARPRSPTRPRRSRKRAPKSFSPSRSARERGEIGT